MVSTELPLGDPIAQFTHWVVTAPDAVAIDDGASAATYGALARQAGAMAESLRGAGCRPGDRVAVYVSSRADLVGSMLGILRAGAVFAPLELGGPEDRLRDLLRRLRPRFLVHDGCPVPSWASGADGCQSLEVSRDADGEEWDDGSAAVPARGAPAYVYFTSGSTGHPKGIVGRLDALGARIDWEIERLQVTQGTRVSQLVTPTFDPWFRDVFVPLCAGGTLCLPPQSPFRMLPEKLIEWLRDARVEIVHCGPSLLGELVSAPARIRRLPALRAVLSAGETLHVSLARRWRRRFGRRAALINLYGPTEATMFQFFHEVSAEDMERSFIPIGRSLPGVEVIVSDPDGERCAPGVFGEILIGGDTLSLGYLDDSHAMARAFVRRGENGAVFYCTGDEGVEFEPGCYRLLGRLDDQVKIRGVRIEPREVEDALIGYPLVGTCAVTSRYGPEGEPALVAYIVPETDYPPAIPDMRAYLRERFPLEYVPAAFVLLQALPLGPTGKVDRRLLPDPEDAPSAPAVASSPTPPRNRLEQGIASGWTDVLALPAVGVHDNFFDLGGHSLSAMRLVSRLHANGVGELQLREVFDCPTVAQQAARLRERTGEARKRAHEQPAEATATVLPPRQKGFGCPRTPSPDFGRRACNLVLVVGEDDDWNSFLQVAHHVAEHDPTIQPYVVKDTPRWWDPLEGGPTLVFSPAILRHRPERPMHIACGYPLAKSEEYGVLERARIAVPRWTTLEEGQTPDLSDFSRYVIRKPDYGAKGAEIRIVRRDRVRWKPIVTSAAGPSPRLIVQDFVYTGRWPVSYRVNTLFGRVLYCVALTGNPTRPPLEGPEDFDARGPGGQSVSIVSNARDSVAELCVDAGTIEFGERAARAFPDVPLLGVDVLQDARNGKRYAVEVNALGHNWNLTPQFRDAVCVDVASQFDGLRKAAYVLAEETQRRASS